MLFSFRKKILRIIKKILLIDPKVSLGSLELLENWNIKLGRHIYKRKYSVEDIISEMKKNGLRKGDNIFIHSSWGAFYNFMGSEEDLISAILNAIGPSGTMAMPAYPLNKKKIFNVSKSVTGAGLLAEAFRKYPGVKRSINCQHSVCAIGPMSDYLLAEHNKSLICFDEHSPYYKLTHIQAKIFSIGLPPYHIGTIVHTVECVLKDKYRYFSDFYGNEKKIAQYVDYDNSIKQYYYIPKNENIHLRTDYFRNRYIVKKYFDKTKYSYTKISNLYISCFDAEYTHNRLIDLAQNGITLYITPKYYPEKLENESN